MEKDFTEFDRKPEIPIPPSGSDRLNQDEYWMLLALEEARLAATEGEVPVGAVILLNNRFVAGSHNQPVSLNDPTAHAEILAIREAAGRTGNYRLKEMTLYVTLEPCIMCAGAILQARLKRLVYGTNDPKSGAVNSLFGLLEDDRLNHSVQVTGGVLQAQCAEILSGFFRKKRITSSFPNQGAR